MRDGTASRTAQRVAAHRLSFSREAGTGRPQDDDALARDVAAGVEVEPGPMHEYLRARTAFFDRAVVDALDAGTCQVVLVGAGYDGRAWRYARLGVRFFEVDHPDTQADKRARVARLGLSTASVTFVAVDLACDPLGPRLEAAGHGAGVPTLFVVEGLLAYLEDDVVARTLTALHERSAPRSRLAVSVGIATDDPERRARVAAFRARVAELGEAVRSELDAGAAVPLFSAWGWRVRARGQDLARDEGLGLLLADAETTGAG